MLTAKDALLLSQKQEPGYSEYQLTQIGIRICQAAEKGRKQIHYPTVSKTNQSKLSESGYSVVSASKWNDEDNYYISWQ